ncbi:MAG: hypothetical protein LH478_13700 [Chitinophagaceae bacterium]|nr:hypothetical protein [Chitinophagaceae bacterium]
MNENYYRLDKSIVATKTFSEADDHVSYWIDKTEDERLNAACSIINQIFGVTPNTKVDRRVKSKRKHK